MERNDHDNFCRQSSMWSVPLSLSSSMPRQTDKNSCDRTVFFATKYGGKEFPQTKVPRRGTVQKLTAKVRKNFLTSHLLTIW